MAMLRLLEEGQVAALSALAFVVVGWILMGNKKQPEDEQLADYSDPSEQAHFERCREEYGAVDCHGELPTDYQRTPRSPTLLLVDD